MWPVTAILWLVGCTGSQEDTAPPPSLELRGPAPQRDVSSPCVRGGSSPEVLSFSATPDTDLVTRVDLELTLSERATVRASCVQDADPDEVHVVESDMPVLDHLLVIHGLLADEEWTCTAEAVCPQGGAPVQTRFTSAPLPADLPQGTVTRHDTLVPEGVYTLFNHKGFCDNEVAHRLVVVDPEGRVRWYWDGVDPNFGVGVAAHYLGGGIFLTGGGVGEAAGPRKHDLDGDLLYQTPVEWGYDFHHYAEELPGGTILSLAEAEDHNGSGAWEGFHILEHDPATDEILTTWSSQQAVAAGEGGFWLVSETDVPVNANWVSQDTSGALYASLCGAQRMVKIDPTSGEVLWTLGPGEDFELFGNRGEALEDSEFPECQHGVEVLEPDRLLVYDNGRDRLESRISEYAIDPAAGRAVRTWTWTEPEFYERPWGDVDALSSERVLVGIGHCACCDPSSDNVTRILEVDRATSVVVWRYELPADGCVLYQVDGIGGCDLFANARYCDRLRAP